MTKISKFKRQIRRTDVLHIKQYLEREGWSVVYFNTPSGNEIIDKLNLRNIADKTDGFVYPLKELKFVFINGRLCDKDKLLTLLHESAHIYLNHDLSNTTKKEEAEAWIFAYKILNYKYYFLKCFLVFFCAVILGICVFCSHKAINIHNNEKVYVTPSGSKYHSADCPFIKNKNCLILDIDEAKEKYEPCYYCRP